MILIDGIPARDIGLSLPRPKQETNPRSEKTRAHHQKRKATKLRRIQEEEFTLIYGEIL